MTQTSGKISLTTAIIICMNAMIGAGIFTTPAKLATSVGPAGILSYAFVIVAVVTMALSIARVAQIYPQEGSFYTYAKQWGGHFMGVLAAGAYVIGVIIALGLITQIATDYLHAFMPGIPQTTLGIILITALVALNMTGVKFMQAGQVFLIGCTLFSILVTSILCLLNANIGYLTPFMPHGIGSVFSATKTAIFAFFGFESAASLFTIVKDPRRNVPRALTLSIIIVGIIYMTFISSLILGIDPALFTSARIPLSTVLTQAFPHYWWLGKLIGISIITALLGVLQSMLYSVSMLTQSFFKLLRNPMARALTTSRYSFEIILASIGVFTLINFIAVKNLDLFFILTALFIIFAFIASMLTLPLKHHNKTTGQKLITYLGLITGSIILISAVYDLFFELSKSL